MRETEPTGVPSLGHPGGKYIVEGFTPMAAPSHLDWRNNSGNYVTPIRDQKSCGVAGLLQHAALESATLITLEHPVSISISLNRFLCPAVGLEVVQEAILATLRITFRARGFLLRAATLHGNEWKLWKCLFKLAVLYL